MQISLWLLRGNTKIKANISLCLQMCLILKLFDILKYTLLSEGKFEMCAQEYTHALTNTYKNEYFWSSVFNLHFYQTIFKDNSDSL